MYYDSAVSEGLIAIVTTDPAAIIRGFFSVFGHFGVQLFIFFSAYAMAIKARQNPRYLKFVFNRLRKLYPPFLLAILAYILYEAVFIQLLWGKGLAGIVGYVQLIWQSLALKLTLLWNFVPGEGFSLVGPWWFLSLIVQFYLAFPLIIRLRNRYGSATLLGLSVTALSISLGSGGSIGGVSVYFTLIGHLPLFCLGIYLAEKDRFVIPSVVILGSLALFIAGNFNEHLFHFTHLSMFVLLLCGASWLKHRFAPDSFTIRLVLVFGVLSMPMFLLNGFMRAPLEGFAHKIDNEFISLLFALVHLGVVTVASIIFLWIEDLLFKQGKGRAKSMAHSNLSSTATKQKLQPAAEH